ncbi:MAG: type II toxin-antitoxin system VapC family toxin [Planktothrix agardhii LY1]|jgi:predicted nucleic acid-binding protein|uniref:type II toxin-antitoxin system VapC family toxin n=2 Tax=Planktothrix agardhii TaxID=1160 RepID=UPI0024324C2E|nr:type II toxin-antitoxin system VapC family toxin [Planktothrix agardhii]MCP9293510.1 type II toxin-antitoxin system VapC family toxin [Planktothrix agardhii LY1]MEA5563425.1 type II toxin-antitoxin system VapC family toxin [Planktothrix agardhii UHCC 0887]
MTDFLVDSNVILDLLTEDPHWFDWSSAQLADCAQTGTLHINPIIYAEVSIGFKDVTEVELVLSSSFFQRDALPYEAAFLAGQAFLQYRRRGGVRRSPLPDFYIGAHAKVCGYTLLTRDATRYQTYFPELILISPEV